MQIIDGSFELYGLDHLPRSQRVKVHTAVRWARATGNKTRVSCKDGFLYNYFQLFQSILFSTARDKSSRTLENKGSPTLMEGVIKTEL